MSAPVRLLGWVALLAILGWFLVLPLRDVLAYPDRLSVYPNLETDAAAYDAFARDLAETWHISSLPAKHPPGWMVALAIVYAVVGHSYVAGKLLSWIALLLAVGLSAWLARRVYDTTAAVIAALLCASSPGLRAYVGTLQYEVVTAALFTLFLVLVIRAAAPSHNAHQHRRRAILAGVAGAALILTRETFVLVVPIAAMWLWSQLRKAPVTPGPRPLATALLLILVAATPAVAWSAAQTVYHQRLILISEKGPKEFQLGNNPVANGTYNEPLAGMAEPAGIAFIRSSPLHALRLAGRKVLYCFGVLRDGWNVPHPAAVWLWRATTGAVPLPVIEPIIRGGWLLAMTMIAVAMLGRDGVRQWWLLIAATAAILAVHVITIGSYRFGLPLLPVMYVLASGPLAQLARLAAPALRSLVVATACVVLIGVAIAAQYQSWPLRAEYAAKDLDGIAAENRRDAVSGEITRFAAAGRGTRPVVLLPDTFLPRGLVRVHARIRRATAAGTNTAVARLTLTQLNGRIACAADILPPQLAVDHFADVTISCRLDRDGPATLAIIALGNADLSIDRVRLAWVN